MQVPVKYGRITVVDRNTVVAAHAAFKKVIVWTVNDGSEMRAFARYRRRWDHHRRPDVLRYVMEERQSGGPGTRKCDVSEWTTVGEITLVQIQRSRLMVDQQFHADELVQAERLRLTPDGVFGLISGAWVLDRHHRQHPDADHWNENRALSVGFTSHYEHMWDLFRRTSAGSAARTSWSRLTRWLRQVRSPVAFGSKPRAR